MRNYTVPCKIWGKKDQILILLLWLSLLINLCVPIADHLFLVAVRAEFVWGVELGSENLRKRGEERKFPTLPRVFIFSPFACHNLSNTHAIFFYDILILIIFFKKIHAILKNILHCSLIEI